MTDGALIVLAGAIGTTTTILVGLYKDARNRKWDAQDREQAAELVRSDAKKAAQVAASLVKQEGDKIRADVATNTLVSAAAKVAAEQAAAKITAVKADVEDLKINGFEKKESP